MLKKKHEKKKDEKFIEDIELDKYEMLYGKRL